MGNATMSFIAKKPLIATVLANLKNLSNLPVSYLTNNGHATMGHRP